MRPSLASRRGVRAASVLCAAAALAACASEEAPVVSQSAVDRMSAELREGFLRADRPREFSFPADHGPHRGFQLEWWYFTGILRTDQGRRFGYELTIFRWELRPGHEPAPSLEADAGGGRERSRWRTGEVYAAHFAVTDEAGRAFHFRERFARGALDLAGASLARVWLEDWSIERTGQGFHLRASDTAMALELDLEPAGPIVLHGEAGLSRKGAKEGNASYYFSMPRLASRGAVTVGGQRHEVSGTSWLDREWSTSALEPGQEGWDWFAVRLDDGRDLVFFQLRRDDGTIDPFSGGTLVAADGQTRTLSREDVRLEPVGTWRSVTGASYPARWRLELPSESLTLELTPWLPDQELDVLFRYWEGAVDVRGLDRGKPLRGEGYVEMVGYGPRKVR